MRAPHPAFTSPPPCNRDRPQHNSEQGNRAGKRTAHPRRPAAPGARRPEYILHPRMAIRRRHHRRVDVDRVGSASLRRRRVCDCRGGGNGAQGVTSEEDEREARRGDRDRASVGCRVALHRRHV